MIKFEKLENIHLLVRYG